MGKKDNQKLKKRTGISANAFIIPVVAVLIFLHMIVFMLGIAIEKDSKNQADIMKSTGEYVETATSLLAGSSLLSETSSNFILMPLTENGDVNISPLTVYSEELNVKRRSKDVIAKFTEYDIEEDVKELLSEAAECAEYMMSAQFHAMALMDSVYHIPDNELLNNIKLPELSDEEKKYTDEQKEAAARRLILEAHYGYSKSTVSRNVNKVVEIIKKETGDRAAHASKQIAIKKMILWSTVVIINIMFIFAFIAMYCGLIMPIKKSVKYIASNGELNDKKGLKEVRQLAYAYNDLRERRYALENILRNAAETDPLTNLPNRYGFENYILDSGREGYSIAIFLFDVNYLKQTNDKHGHAAGDELLRNAAECISYCFDINEENNCFRFGGDEFAAVVKNVEVDRIKEMAAKFEQEQKKRNISIAWGYAYTPDKAKATIKELMEEADRRMYSNKKRMHDNI